MTPVPIICNDAERLEALRRYGILDTPTEAAFDDITRLVATICQTPIALVSFVAEGRQWFKSTVGVDANLRETPLESSICAHALLERDLLIVPDTTADKRTASNPLIAGAPHLRFYAGAVLRADDGQPIGSLCVLDYKPRHLTPDQQDALRILAKQVMAQLELRRTMVQQAAALEELRKGNQLFQGLVNQSNTGIAETDAAGRFVFTNARYSDITGYSPDELRALRMQDITHPEDLPAKLQLLEHMAATGHPFEVEKRYVRKDGSFAWVHNSVSPLRHPSGELRGLVLVSSDITSRRETDALRESLLASERAARVESERTSLIKDEFLATLSHEIRTPLNAILGWSQIMRESKDPQDIAQGLEVIERNTRAQSQIIEDLLDMSRIISGKVRLDVQRVDLAAIVQSAVDAIRPTADAKDIRLQSTIDPLGGVAVTGDPNRLQQILWNLLTNAVKFTPKHGRVQTLLQRVNSHLEIAVTDTGEGIKPEFLPYVFDRFRQADASTTRRHGGLGLGLSIVKQLAELHGGSIRVTSNGPGQGSSFILSLPLTILHAPAEPAADRQHPTTPSYSPPLHSSIIDLTGLKILVVDDEPDARALVRRLLEDRGATITTAPAADDALQLLQSHPFDLLISDIGMPLQDGYSLIRRTRALPAPLGNIPAIALTAYARTEDRIKAISAGFSLHLAKPVEPLELLTMAAAATLPRR